MVLSRLTRLSGWCVDDVVEVDQAAPGRIEFVCLRPASTRKRWSLVEDARRTRRSLSARSRGGASSVVVGLDHHRRRCCCCHFVVVVEVLDDLRRLLVGSRERKKCGLHASVGVGYSHRRW